MDRAKLWGIIRLMIGIGFFAVAIFLALKDSEKIQNIHHYHYLPLLGLLFVHAFNYLFLGWAYHLPLRIHGVKLTTKEIYLISTFTNLTHLFLPAKSGNAFRYLYLHKFKNLKLLDFVNSNLAVSSYALCSLSGVGFLYFSFFSGSMGVNRQIYLLVTAIIFLITLIFLLAPKLFHYFLRKYGTIDPLLYFRSKNLFYVVINLLLVKILYPCKLFLCFKIIGYELSLSQSYEISLIVLIVSLFPVFPGNMGIKEFVAAFVAKGFGIPYEVALLASVIERFSYFIFLIPTGLYGYFFLFPKDAYKNVLWRDSSNEI